jgi:uncharacterized protein (DUF2267 family)
MTTSSHLFDHAVAGAARWIDDLAADLGTADPREARRILRTVLHGLRDRLELHQAIHLSAQLPELVRGMYFEGWVPERHSPRHGHDFLEQIAREAHLHGVTEASYAVSAVMRVLRRHVSAGEVDKVVAVLPAELRPVLAA